jgi:chromosome segregation ATPase
MDREIQKMKKETESAEVQRRKAEALYQAYEKQIAKKKQSYEDYQKQLQDKERSLQEQEDKLARAEEDLKSAKQQEAAVKKRLKEADNKLRRGKAPAEKRLKDLKAQTAQSRARGAKAQQDYQKVAQQLGAQARLPASTASYTRRNLKTACQAFAHPDASSSPVWKGAAGQAVMVSNYDPAWNQVNMKKGPAYISKGCF